MDFNYSREDEAFRAEFRTWLETHNQYATPTRESSADEAEGEWDARIRWHRKLNEGGWMAINWPKEYGGRSARAPRFRHTRILSRLEVACGGAFVSCF